MERQPAKLLDKVRYRIRLKGYSIRTGKSYGNRSGLHLKGLLPESALYRDLMEAVCRRMFDFGPNRI